MTVQTVVEFAAMSDSDLLDLRDMTEAMMAGQQARIDAIDDTITKRHAGVVQAAYTAASKSHGTVTLPLPGGLRAKGEIKRPVKWDSAKLEKLASLLMTPIDAEGNGHGWTYERVRTFFKINFSVDEKHFEASKLHESLNAGLIDARTVDYKPLSVTLLREDE